MSEKLIHFWKTFFKLCKNDLPPFKPVALDLPCPLKQRLPNRPRLPLKRKKNLMTTLNRDFKIYNFFKSIFWLFRSSYFNNDDFSFWWRQIGALHHGRPRQDIKYLKILNFTQTFFEGIDEGSDFGLVGVSISSGNRKCPKNRKKVKKQWWQSDDVIFLFSQIGRIQT